MCIVAAPASHGFSNLQSPRCFSPWCEPQKWGSSYPLGQLSHSMVGGLWRSNVPCDVLDSSGIALMLQLLHSGTWSLGQRWLSMILSTWLIWRDLLWAWQRMECNSKVCRWTCCSRVCITGFNHGTSWRLRSIEAAGVLLPSLANAQEAKYESSEASHASYKSRP